MKTLPDALSDLVCQHVAQYPTHHLPATARHAAARALLDGWGVMAAASGASEDVAPFIDLAAQSGQGPCAILGADKRVGPMDAAFANGAMAHALDYEDAFDLAACHPNASLIPAVLAMAQSGAPVARHDLLSALAIGCDLACRLALCLDKPLEDGGWYPPPILGGLGAVAGAARMARLTADQTRDALSLMLCQLTCPGEIKYSPATVIRAIREAFPAQAAVRSVLLAARGVTGFEQPLEGRSGFFALYADGAYSSDRLLDRLGEHWWGEHLSFKPWPSCRGTHSFVQLGEDLHATPGFDWREIEAVDVHIGEIQQMLVDPLARKQAPHTVIDAKFSIPFTLATAMVKGQLGLDNLTPAALQDPDTLAVSRRIGVIARPDWKRDHSTAGGLRVRLRDGRMIDRELLVPRGGVADPLNDTALTRKFVDCTQRASAPIPAEVAKRMASALLEDHSEPELDGYLNTTPPH